jgi:predicted SprT family Zn-dependent metalloprotease
MDSSENREAIKAEMKSLCEEHSIPVPELIWNSRLRTSAGRAQVLIFNREVAVAKIEMNPRFLEEFGLPETRKVLRHELAHIAADDRAGKSVGHSNAFKRWCLFLGGSLRAPAGKWTRRQQPRWLYRCTCGNTVPRVQRMTMPLRKRRKCRRCGLNLTKWEEINLRERQPKAAQREAIPTEQISLF